MGDGSSRISFREKIFVCKREKFQTSNITPPPTFLSLFLKDKIRGLKGSFVQYKKSQTKGVIDKDNRGGG